MSVCLVLKYCAVLEKLPWKSSVFLPNQIYNLTPFSFKVPAQTKASNSVAKYLVEKPREQGPHYASLFMILWILPTYHRKQKIRVKWPPLFFIITTRAWSNLFPYRCDPFTAVRTYWKFQSCNRASKLYLRSPQELKFRIINKNFRKFTQYFPKF